MSGYFSSSHQDINSQDYYGNPLYFSSRDSLNPPDDQLEESSITAPPPSISRGRRKQRHRGGMGRDKQQKSFNANKNSTIPCIDTGSGFPGGHEDKSEYSYTPSPEEVQMDAQTTYSKLLEPILATKKMSLFQSPEVQEFLKMNMSK